MKEKRSVASVNGKGAMIVGMSDVIRWGDVMTINGTEVDVAKAVELGIEKGIDIAQKLVVDLKSDEGLLVTFPMLFLMDRLQRLPEIGTGERLLELVKPE